MRVLIMGDMEGVCGIQSWEHTGGNHPLYDEGRRLYTEEINAAVRGCKKAGASEVVCVDGHGGGYTGCRSFMNWVPEKLERGAEYVMGHVWTRYVEPLEQQFDAVLLVGAHSRAGTPDGILCHTVSADTWNAVYVNDEVVGEIGIEASIAGCFGVPVIFVSGDAAACREANAFIGPGLVTAQVKRGLSRYMARNLSPADARALIEEHAMQAVFHKDNWPKPVETKPCTLRVEFATPERATPYAGREGIRVVPERSVESDGATFWEAWDRFWTNV